MKVLQVKSYLYIVVNTMYLLNIKLRALDGRGHF